MNFPKTDREELIDYYVQARVDKIRSRIVNLFIFVFSIMITLAYTIFFRKLNFGNDPFVEVALGVAGISTIISFYYIYRVKTFNYFEAKNDVIMELNSRARG